MVIHTMEYHAETKPLIYETTQKNLTEARSGGRRQTRKNTDAVIPFIESF